MSFVGPRPLYKSTVDANVLGWKRSEARPGLTGLAQVSGNTQLSDREKFALDAYYVDRRGPIDDVLILLRTVAVVLLGERRNEPLIRKALEYANGFDRRG
jgi:lipopolysaccharide/colanic/teichoic acid biosynthesis glycosyltransferase